MRAKDGDSRELEVRAAPNAVLCSKLMPVPHPSTAADLKSVSRARLPRIEARAAPNAVLCSKLKSVPRCIHCHMPVLSLQVGGLGQNPANRPDPSIG